MGRPVADSPEYFGDLYYVYVPVDPSVKDSPWVLHRLTTNKESFSQHLETMTSKGIELYRVEVETRSTSDRST